MKSLLVMIVLLMLALSVTTAVVFDDHFEIRARGQAQRIEVVKQVVHSEEYVMVQKPNNEAWIGALHDRWVE